ncbi:MAG: hypothetical protein RL213_2242 [Bacteroidota bacterium]
MKSFIGDLADELIRKFGTDFTGITVVFPTRRAGVFFRSEIARRISGPVWAPRVLAVQDFMLELADRSQPDQVTLLFELFDIYREFFPDEPFDEYCPWGEVMLKDFDELDKSLANPSKVFSVIADLREIDESFGLDDEEMERLRMFWGNYFDTGSTRLKEEFSKTWKHLHTIYDRFHARLGLKGWTTEGHAYRTVAASLGHSDGWKERVGRHVVFAGLYALSRSEEQVILHLKDHGIADCYWDADEYYVNDRHQEAGHFLRSSRLFDPAGSSWIGRNLGGTEKSIEVIGIPMEVGQAKMAGHLVDVLSRMPGFEPERTAVVLPAEHLLFPVLYAIPESMQKINVTMGYPLHQSPIFHLIESLVTLQTNVRHPDQDSKCSFLIRDVLSVIDHPYIRLVDPSFISAWRKDIVGEVAIRITADRLSGADLPEIFRVLFRPEQESTGLFRWLREILRVILSAMDERSFAGQRFESEFIARLFTQLNLLQETYASVEVESGIATWWRLFSEIIHATKLPFTGEPLEGLQLMGFLESRVLDFENVILLSVNEDILPSSGQHPSFVPYGIRKAFGMPTHEDVHAVTAYHFYRLLQRAGKIFLLHNTEAASISSGEPSRFILQLEQELAARYPDTVKFSRKNMLTPVSGNIPAPVVVEKTPQVMERLQQWIYDEKKDLQFHPKLSPSALNKYIHCPLQFYFSYVAGLWEPDEKDEVLEAKSLGLVLHRAMELLYSESSSTITSLQFAGLHRKVEEAVDQAILDKFADPGHLEGKNLLLRNVIVELVRQILRSDEKEAPVSIVELEQVSQRPFEFAEGRQVVLSGIIDRVDRISRPDGDIYRVIDYKTGKVEFRKIESADDLLRDSVHKEQFQAMLYAWFLSKRYPGKPVQVGLVTLREMSGGKKLVNPDGPLSEDQLLDFEKSLARMITELFDPEVPFRQTDKEDACKYCAYADICNR